MKASKVIVIDYGRDLFKSKAWISLTGKATQVYMLFLTKRRMVQIKMKGQKKRVCDNCMELEFTYLEAERWGISKKQFVHAIDQLWDRGFLSVEETGGACQGDKSKYGLINNWVNYDKKDEFKRGKHRKFDPVRRGYRNPKRKKVTSLKGTLSNVPKGDTKL